MSQTQNYTEIQKNIVQAFTGVEFNQIESNKIPEILSKCESSINDFVKEYITTKYSDRELKMLELVNLGDKNVFTDFPEFQTIYLDAFKAAIELVKLQWTAKEDK